MHGVVLYKTLNFWMRLMTVPAFRLATLGDAQLVKAISASAYIPAYRVVIGAVPKPT
jgi:hypothetical protein